MIADFFESLAGGLEEIRFASLRAEVGACVAGVFARNRRVVHTSALGGWLERDLPALRSHGQGIAAIFARMNVRRAIGFLKRRAPWAHSDLKVAFELIYGDPPDGAQLDTLIHEIGEVDSYAPVRAYRRIVAAFDHHHVPTAFNIRFGPDDVETIAIDEVSLVVDQADHSVSHPIAEGVYEPHLLAFVRSFLKPGMTFVDVGANIGLYSMLAASLVGSEGRVIAVEPNSENCRLLMLSVHRNDARHVSLHPVACGPERGYAAIRTALGSNGGFIESEGEALLDPTAIVVPVAPLDDLVDGPVDLVKIDVEGAEALVMSGAHRIIDERRPTVISEFSQEMLNRVSGVKALDYLQGWIDKGYEINLCRRDTHEIAPVPDPAAFIEGFASYFVVEDLILKPR